jgi:sulfatase maturation enzyme AslB (radical SAM superfamily)
MNEYVKINRLEYMVTRHCSSQCIHCFLPDEKPGGPHHIDAELAVRILRDLGQQYQLESVMTFGGEPLLYPEVVYAIHREATRLNIPSRQVITNGYWSKDAQKTRAIAQSLAQAGVNNIAFSVDAFHQEHVPLEQVKVTASALVDAGIPKMFWNPCWLVSEDDDNEYNHKTRSILEELREFPIKSSEGNVMESDGKARIHLSAYFQKGFAWSQTSCQDIPYMDRFDNLWSICVEPNGDIPLCPAFMLGNTKQQNILDMLDSYDPYADPEITRILEKGIDGVMQKAQASGIELDEEGYYSICDLCTSVRGHEKWEQVT